MPEKQIQFPPGSRVVGYVNIPARLGMFSIPMPEGAKVLSVDDTEVDGAPCGVMSILCDPRAAPVRTTFLTLVQGLPCDEKHLSDVTYVGKFMGASPVTEGAAEMFHLFKQNSRLLLPTGARG